MSLLLIAIPPLSAGFHRLNAFRSNSHLNGHDVLFNKKPTKQECVYVLYPKHAPHEYGWHPESALPRGNIIDIFFKKVIERLLQRGDGSIVRIVGPDIFHIASVKMIKQECVYVGASNIFSYDWKYKVSMPFCYKTFFNNTFSYPLSPKTTIVDCLSCSCHLSCWV